MEISNNRSVTRCPKTTPNRNNVITLIKHFDYDSGWSRGFCEGGKIE
jgi:hypothetical protein